MMRKLPWILLAISIIFNFTFAGGFLQARSELQDVSSKPASRTSMVADQLKLDEGQRKVYTDLRTKAHDEARQQREAIALARQELWSLMSDAKATPEQVRAAQVKLSELHEEYRKQMAAHFRQFFSVLKPAQRETLTERMRRHEKDHRGGRYLLEKFDHDRDGHLDEKERDEARRAIHGRHPGPGHYRGKGGPSGGRYPTWKPPSRDPKRMEAMRKRMIEMFDKDGDGKLSEAEKSEWRKAMGWSGPRRPMPPGSGSSRPSYRSRRSEQ